MPEVGLVFANAVGQAIAGRPRGEVALHPASEVDSELDGGTVGQVRTPALDAEADRHAAGGVAIERQPKLLIMQICQRRQIQPTGFIGGSQRGGMLVLRVADPAGAGGVEPAAPHFDEARADHQRDRAGEMPFGA